VVGTTRNLVTNYGGTRTVDDRSLTIGQGEIFGLIGPMAPARAA
jgi:ABC-type multidrug transport system ATPase subunit